MKKLEPPWKLEGEAIASRGDATQCYVGRDVARQFGVAPGGQLELDYLGRSARLTIAGVVDAGGAEDSQVFVNLAVAQKLAGGVVPVCTTTTMYSKSTPAKSAVR